MFTLCCPAHKQTEHQQRANTVTHCKKCLCKCPQSRSPLRAVTLRFITLSFISLFDSMDCDDDEPEWTQRPTISCLMSFSKTLKSTPSIHYYRIHSPGRRKSAAENHPSSVADFHYTLKNRTGFSCRLKRSHTPGH